MIQAQIFTALLNSAEVQAIVFGRVYPVRLPREVVLPAVVYHVAGIEPVSHLEGDSGVDNNTIELSCWAKDYSTVQSLVRAVRASLSGLMVTVEDQSDGEDLETRSYSVSLIVKAWSKL